MGSRGSRLDGFAGYVSVGNTAQQWNRGAVKGKQVARSTQSTCDISKKTTVRM